MPKLVRSSEQHLLLLGLFARAALLLVHQFGPIFRILLLKVLCLQFSVILLRICGDEILIGGRLWRGWRFRGVWWVTKKEKIGRRPETCPRCSIRRSWRCICHFESSCWGLVMLLLVMLAPLSCCLPAPQILQQASAHGSRALRWR